MSAAEIRNDLDLLHPAARVILALDEMSWSDINETLREVSDYVGVAKLNSRSRRKGLDYSIGQVSTHSLGFMDDSKYKDTPRTMRDSVRESTEAGSDLITVHVSAKAIEGDGLKYAVEGRDQAREILKTRLGENFNPFVGTLLGITVLTSENDTSCRDTYGAPVRETVIKLAQNALRYGLDGIVCGVDDLEYLQKDKELATLLKVTPGIVLGTAISSEGQSRVNTAKKAILSGADYVVPGSVITQASSKLEAAKLVLRDVMDGLAEAA